VVQVGIVNPRDNSELRSTAVDVTIDTEVAELVWNISGMHEGGLHRLWQTTRRLKEFQQLKLSPLVNMYTGVLSLIQMVWSCRRCQ
ncbi:hypothetical protein MJH54_29545, partial [Salmonella enterica subsp. enterica serovar Montevideo]|nr:hypothetical protein [Salmonella enterica subsp. enterica serovar Montevideo]